MIDPHLNIFYSYNRDNEQIENNMTRAFIVTLKFLRSSTLARFLISLLSSKRNDIDPADLQKVKFALQGNIDVDLNLIRKCARRYILAITGDGLLHGPEEMDYGPSSCNEEQIRPDAWIFDSKKPPEFCLLIESKSVENLLGVKQIMAYSRHYFGYHNYDELHNNLISITWYDIVDKCSYFYENDYDYDVNEQERAILKDLVEFLRYCKVIPFSGWNTNSIPECPNYNLSTTVDFRFEAISNSPNYAFPLIVTFGTDKVPKLPSYSINTNTKI